MSALKSISLNLLDREGRVLMTMSAAGHAPDAGRAADAAGAATRRSTGCRRAVRRWDHRAVLADLVGRTTDLLGAGGRPDWGTHRIVDFARVVQPVLNQHCVKCHSGPTPGGAIDLSGNRTRFFSMAYDSLIKHSLVDWFSPLPRASTKIRRRCTGRWSAGWAGTLSRTSTTARRPPGGPPAGLHLDQCQRPLLRHLRVQQVPRGFAGPARRLGHRQRAGLVPQTVPSRALSRCLACHRRVVDAQTAYYGVKLPVTSKLWTDRALNEHAL